MEHTTILVQDLVKRYNKAETLALRGLNFQVKRGEVFGYLGPNGAGKTTTIRIMAGLSRPTEGSCQILGKDTHDNPALYNHLGVVFEESNLYERLSGWENLRFFAKLHGIQTERARELLAQYGLEKAATKPVSTYSKGMKRRLLICRALLHDPEILIMDEPTSGLDPTSASVIHTAINGFRQRGKTVFLSTHDMGEADSLCDRVAFINRGEIAALDRPQILKRRYGEPALVIEVLPNQQDLRQLQTALPSAQFTWADETLQVRLPLDQTQLGAQIDLVRAHGEILTMHSQEASLGQVFRDVTGAHLHSE